MILSKPKIAIVVGSKSDLQIIKGCEKILNEFNVDYDLKVLSAHRTPVETQQFAQNADKVYDLIIAGAGKAAHLPGVIASYTILPVIGLPIKSSTLDGIDSLLSIVQMPKGIPVATVAIDGAENAALLACHILTLKYPYIKELLVNYRKRMADEVLS
ncbi:5-(carboxyamino)imidazole ribonucleotide mutase [Aceticella autotrophica]|uniref:N5-carboxyaminoimidazole ribonucleotide mutase n=1 Tax=Aceticella autotrophica TaxID=2755338 RepID=A0A975AV01_9THEO|nr:5-(carboxyamino)imidazole ribonucleotide mutase [Aceticella autotrophica]QSZ26944.1 5-(carboxyamino)imidazole ribonucleotide mutase [Aceticella autotrophica]